MINDQIEKLSEPELIIQAQAGNPQALEALIQIVLPDVYRLTLRYMQNSFDAEDATQETFVKIWKHLNKFDTSKNFKNWILEIAKNTCLDMLKKKRVIPFSAFDTEAGSNFLEETLPATQPTPLELAEQSSLKHALQKLTAKLSPAYRKVLALYYDQSMNFREIAEALDEPINTVKSRHRRALIMLRRLVDRTGRT